MSSSDDFNGRYGPGGGREADDYSGGAQGAGARGAGAQGAGRNGDGYRGSYTRGNGSGSAGGNGAGAGAGKYPNPEGWGDDGFWRDSSMDADYETGVNNAVRTSDNSPFGNGGYTYWADGKGWENSAGNTAGRGGRPRQGDRAGRGAQGGGFPNGRAGGNGGAAFARGAAAGAAAGYPTRAESGADFLQPGSPGAGPGGYRGGGRGPGAGQGPGGPGGRGPGRDARGLTGRPGRGKVKVKGSWWRHWTWKKVLALVAAGFAGVVVLIVAGFLYEYNSTQIPTQLASDIFYQNSTVYYSNGTTVIGRYGVDNIHRQILTYNQIPKIVQDAVLAAEDRSFWTEGAISPTGILRAAYDDLTSSGGGLAGGSTITQQFVRNYYNDIGTQQTVGRKIKEIFVAMKVSKEETKQWILTNYLNTINLGTGAYGVAAAAQTYFGVPVSKLTVAQAAVIAAIIQQPSNYPLPQYRPELEARWHYVLDGMVKMGDLTQAQADAMKFPAMNDEPEQSYGPDPWDPYIMNVVQNELEDVDHISLAQLETGGYKIITTISRPMEVALYQAVDSNEELMAQDGGPLPSYALVGAELQDPANGSIIAMYAGRGQNMSKAQCQKYDCDVNTAVYAREQVGSSFKPYVLSAAVQEGMNVQTSILNGFSPLWVPPDTDPLVLSARSAKQALPGAYEVNNDGDESLGPLTVQNAFAQSSNAAFTDLAHRVGTQNIINMAANMGVNISPYPEGSGLESYLGEVGIALGIAPLTVNEQDTMLSTITDNGVYHSAHLVKTIIDTTGTSTPGIVTSHVVLSAAEDSQVQYAMSTVTTEGTGTAAEMSDGRPIIAKTGTTNSAQSAFFIGAIPQYSLSVGIFTENQSTSTTETLNGLGGDAGGGFGGYWPARIWNTFAEAEFAQLPVEQFLTPQFSGEKWNQVGNLPKKAKKKPKKHPSPSPSDTLPGHGHQPFPTPPVTPAPTGSPSGQPSPTVSPTASPTDTATTGEPGGPGGGGGGGGGGGAGTDALSADGVQAGVALGGLSVLPGSLLWTRASRRRRRRRRPGTVG